MMGNFPGVRVCDSVFSVLMRLKRLVDVPRKSIKRRVRKAQMRKILSEAEKYRGYYVDELSRKILDCREEYLISGDDTAFLRLASSEGFTFSDCYLYREAGGSRLVMKREGGEWHLYDESRPCVEETYSGAVLLCDKGSERLERAEMFIATCGGLKDCRLVDADEISECGLSGNEIIINAVSHHMKRRRIAEYIRSYGLDSRFIGGMLWYNTDAQYFDVFKPAENETVLDVGAYDGETAIRFLKWGGDRIRRVYAFDFDPANITKCRRNIEPYRDKITLIEKGTWDKEETLTLDSGLEGSGSSRVSFGGGTTIASLTTIDNAMKDEPVTLIKMDIEGAELKSLMGAKNTILRNKPRLAISVYHKPEDICEIPGYILSLVPEYKLMLRHYSSTFAETILYAYCE